MFAVMRIHQFVMSLEVGVVPEDGDQWRALAHCFWDDTAKTNKDDDHVPISSGFVQVVWTRPGNL